MSRAACNARPGARRPAYAGGGPFSRALVQAIALAWLMVAALAPWSAPARALEPIDVSQTQQRIEITFLGQFYEARGDRLQVETAAGDDGIGGRMAVRAITPGTDPNWAVFALKNPTDNVIERWLIAERYTLLGSGLIWPDLDSPRIVRVTPSLGFLPERIANDQADIISITLEPRQTVTYVTELASDRFPRLYIWNPSVYQKKQRESMLFQGILIGISVVIAIFLTAVYAANHQLIFPAAALVAWSVLSYLCIDFGFWHKLFQVSPQDIAYFRAAAEAAIAASLVIFLYAYMRPGIRFGWARLFILLWGLAQVGVIGLAMLDPGLASSIARVSFGTIAVIGTLLVLSFAITLQARGLSLLPAWMMLLVWIFGAAVSVMGRLSGDAIVPGLSAGLVLVLILLAITVAQFATRSAEPQFSASPSQLQLRSLAIDMAGAGVWEWNARRDEIATGAVIEEALGLQAGELNARAGDWLEHVHSADRERIKAAMSSIQERGEGVISLSLRLRRFDGFYRWYELDAATVPQVESRTVKCVGLLRDITDTKLAHDRLIQDAVQDTLTGLPNRQIFIDRLGCAIARAEEFTEERPTVIIVDIDRFKNVNKSFGINIGDGMLLTIARRLSRHLGPRDTLARMGGDQFAVLIERSLDQRQLALLAERIRRALRSPVKIDGQSIVLTGSIGIAEYDGSQKEPGGLLRDAELAMQRAKRVGSDRTEVFTRSMREEGSERILIESDLRRAIQSGQLHVVYQPIVRLANSELSGFEALVRWHHPTRGVLNPDEFISIAEEIDMVAPISSYVLARAREELARWQKLLPRREDPLFVSINISSSQLFRPEFIQELRGVLRSEATERGSIRLEMTESLAMQNPELAAEILELLKEAGAGLMLDDFGTGHSSIAYLHRFVFDTIKLDKALIQNHALEAAGGVIVRSIVAMSQELGREVVAEGVETYEDAIALRGIGCDFAQGFYFGGLMTERQVSDLLKSLARDERAVERPSLLESAIRMIRSRQEGSEKGVPDDGDVGEAGRPMSGGGGTGESGSVPGEAGRADDGDGPGRQPRGVPVRPAMPPGPPSPAGSSGQGPANFMRPPEPPTRPAQRPITGTNGQTGSPPMPPRPGEPPMSLGRPITGRPGGAPGADPRTGDGRPHAQTPNGGASGTGPGGTGPASVPGQGPRSYATGPSPIQPPPGGVARGGNGNGHGKANGEGAARGPAGTDDSATGPAGRSRDMGGASLPGGGTRHPGNTRPSEEG
ncbi:MAG: EAL domain-containing protein [Rhizobiales bacterium]|nr:EAL domain-containing protein [Hyphomicrobiales bacterium]